MDLQPIAMKKKTVLIVILVLAVAAIAAVAFVWNKPHETVDNKKGTAVTAEMLANAFIQNEQQANATYLNQVLEVTGTAEEVSTNQDGKTVILLKADDPLSGVQCTMSESQNVKQGDQLTIKGFCNGYTTVVLLSDCVMLK